MTLIRPMSPTYSKNDIWLVARGVAGGRRLSLWSLAPQKLIVQPGNRSEEAEI